MGQHITGCKGDQHVFRPAGEHHQGEVAHKALAAFSAWCEDRNRNLDFEIKTGNMQVEELKASIAQEDSLTMSLAAESNDL